MSILRAAIKLIVKEHALHRYSGRVLSLGVPEAHARADELEAWFRESGIESDTVRTIDRTVTTNEIGARHRFMSGRAFLSHFGFSAIDCLDVPGCEHPPEITHDLNDPISSDQYGSYDFVLDPGTLEHVFDQAVCLQNIARFLIVGGTVCHLVPVYSYNGGYYSINPNVLYDFYRANGFTVDAAYIIMWDRYRAYSQARTRCYRYDPVILGSRHAIGDLDQVRFTPHLLLFARKLENVSEFRAPLQFDGNYAAEAASLKGTRELALESRGKRLAAIAFDILPFSFAYYLQSAVYRWLTFVRARRVASFMI